MRSYKSQKIDFDADYPCPCRRKGRIVPITLTEAFGCNRCQQIFVVREDGYVIEQLSTHYPYKRTWRWTGQQWRMERPVLSSSYLPLFTIILFTLIVFVLLLATFQAPTNAEMAIRLLAIVTVSLLLMFMFWLASRR